MTNTKTPVLILPGWKVPAGRYKEIQQIFEKNGHAAYTVDMPGFGKEELTKPIMNLNDYVSFLNIYIQQHKLQKIILVGHSFGGRVATKFTNENPEKIEKLIITGAPLIRRPLSFKKRAVTIMARIGKHTLAIVPQRYTDFFRRVLYKSIGEWDYYKSGNLRETFKNIINEDLSKLLPFIIVPTLVIWGRKDTFVPLEDGEEIAERIPESTLVVVANASHKLPYENAKEFAYNVLNFIK